MNENEQTVRYYLYDLEGRFSGSIDLPVTAAAPARSTLDAPLVTPGETIWRVGGLWLSKPPFHPSVTPAPTVSVGANVNLFT